MPATLSIHSILARPDTLCFPSNRPYALQFDEQGGRVAHLSSGHHVLYGRHGRRLLLADPEGYPLHECEWETNEQGRDLLVRARVRLDWGQWVGVRPGGLVNATTLDLSTKPGWQRLRADDLRLMAARAMQVPIEEVRLFYGEPDLLIDRGGTATIRHRKDALYVLEDGTFERCRFMACMGAMHWEDIDFLPVVELFQSLLPGTGSAVFELIRGLYDDQNADRPAPRALRYRGIPTYPSEAAFRLFSAFFTAHAPRGEEPLPLFMDAPRSHEVTWLPAAEYPRRYVGQAGHLCVTVKQRIIEKLTLSDDGAGLSYVAPSPRRPAPCDRTVYKQGDEVVLNDRGRRTRLATNPRWGPLVDIPDLTAPAAAVKWSDLFKAAPSMTGSEAFSAVLLYPDDDTEIGELPSQSFVMDYLQDVLEQDAAMTAMMSRAHRILVHLFDGAISGCIDSRRPRDYTVVYRSGPFAQKHAQVLWNRFAGANRLPWLQGVHMYGVTEAPHEDRPYDVVYGWIPFTQFVQPAQIDETIGTLTQRMVSGGTAFLVGPDQLARLTRQGDLAVESSQAVEDLPSFHIHRTILPKARLKAGLTLYRVRRR